MDLSEDLVAFRFEISYNLSIEKLESLTNKTYFVHQAYYVKLSQTSKEQIELDIVKCKSPTLEGYYCFDFSKLKNQLLYTDFEQSVQSMIQISTYGCYDTDYWKVSVPSNCADPADINSVLNSLNSGIKIKIKTSQFNTTSKQIETSYRGSKINTLQNQLFLTAIRIQQQITQIKQGYFFQSESNFTSALSYGVEMQSLDKQRIKEYANLGSISQIDVLLDDLYSEIQIQYITIPTILSQVNSIFQVLLLMGFIGRQISRKSMKNDFIFTYFKNTYLQKYLQTISFYQSIQQVNQITEEQKEATQKDLKNSEELNEKDILEKTFLNEIQSCSFKPKHILDLYKSKKDSFQTYGISNSIQFNDKTTFNDETPFQKKEKNLIQNQQLEMINSESDKQQESKSNHQDFNDQLQYQIYDFKGKKKEQIHQQSKQLENLMYKQQNIEDDKPNQNLNKPQDAKQTQNIYYQIIQVLKNQTIQARAYKILFQDRFCRKRDFISDEKLSEDLRKKIEFQIRKDLNIFSIYQDILFLKKAIMILFSQEQLATLQLVGCSNNYLDLSQSQLQNQLQQDDSQVNHYEKQQAILTYDEIHSKYLKQFFKKCQRKEKLSKIDQRIISSIPKNLFNL